MEARGWLRARRSRTPSGRPARGGSAASRSVGPVRAGRGLTAGPPAGSPRRVLEPTPFRVTARLLRSPHRDSNFPGPAVRPSRPEVSGGRGADGRRELGRRPRRRGMGTRGTPLTPARPAEGPPRCGGGRGRGNETAPVPGLATGGLGFCCSLHPFPLNRPHPNTHTDTARPFLSAGGLCFPIIAITTVIIKHRKLTPTMCKAFLHSYRFLQSSLQP